MSSSSDGIELTPEKLNPFAEFAEGENMQQLTKLIGGEQNEFDGRLAHEILERILTELSALSKGGTEYNTQLFELARAISCYCLVNEHASFILVSTWVALVQTEAEKLGLEKELKVLKEGQATSVATEDLDTQATTEILLGVIGEGDRRTEKAWLRK